MRKIEESKLDLLTLDFNRFMKEKVNSIPNQDEQLIFNNLNRLYYINQDLNQVKISQPSFELFKFVDKPKKEEEEVKKGKEKEEALKKGKDLVKEEEFKEKDSNEKKIFTNLNTNVGGNTNLFGFGVGNNNKQEPKPESNLFMANKNAFTGSKETKEEKKRKVEVPQPVNLFPGLSKVVKPVEEKKAGLAEINKPLPVEKKPEENIIPKSKSTKDKLLEAANKYWTSVRDKMREISNNPMYKKPTEKIELEINLIVNQLNNQQEVQEKVTNTKKLLQEIYREKSEDLYAYALNLICQRVIIKSEKFVKEDKKNYLILSGFLYQISQSHYLFQDFILMVLAFKCPYIIPKVYTKSDYPDKNTFLKRLGYSNAEETFSEWMNNMESYSYLYFCYLFQGNSSPSTVEIAKNYVEALENVNVDPPIAVGFKTFLNAYGGKFCQNVGGGVGILKKLTSKFIKGLEDLKNKSKTADIKQIAGENIHFIKKYFTSINGGQPTEMHK